MAGCTLLKDGLDAFSGAGVGIEAEEMNIIAGLMHLQQ